MTASQPALTATSSARRPRDAPGRSSALARATSASDSAAADRVERAPARRGWPPRSRRSARAQFVDRRRRRGAPRRGPRSSAWTSVSSARRPSASGLPQPGPLGRRSARCSSSRAEKPRLDLALGLFEPAAASKAQRPRPARAAARARPWRRARGRCATARVLARLEQAPLRGRQPLVDRAAGPSARRTTDARASAWRSVEARDLFLARGGRRGRPVPASAATRRACRRRPAPRAARSRRRPSPAGGSPPSATRWRRTASVRRCSMSAAVSTSRLTVDALGRQALAQVAACRAWCSRMPRLSSRPDPPSTTRGPRQTSPSRRRDRRARHGGGGDGLPRTRAPATRRRRAAGWRPAYGPVTDTTDGQRHRARAAAPARRQRPPGRRRRPRGSRSGRLDCSAHEPRAPPPPGRCARTRTCCSEVSRARLDGALVARVRPPGSRQQPPLSGRRRSPARAPSARRLRRPTRAPSKLLERREPGASMPASSCSRERSGGRDGQSCSMRALASSASRTARSRMTDPAAPGPASSGGAPPRRSCCARAASPPGRRPRRTDARGRRTRSRAPTACSRAWRTRWPSGGRELLTRARPRRRLPGRRAWPPAAACASWASAIAAPAPSRSRSALASPAALGPLVSRRAAAAPGSASSRWRYRPRAARGRPRAASSWSAARGGRSRPVGVSGFSRTRRPRDSASPARSAPARARPRRPATRAAGAAPGGPRRCGPPRRRWSAPDALAAREQHLFPTPELVAQLPVAARLRRLALQRAALLSTSKTMSSMR